MFTVICGLRVNVELVVKDHIYEFNQRASISASQRAKEFDCIQTLKHAVIPHIIVFVMTVLSRAIFSGF